MVVHKKRRSVACETATSVVSCPVIRLSKTRYQRVHEPKENTCKMRWKPYYLVRRQLRSSEPRDYHLIVRPGDLFPMTESSNDGLP